MFERLLSGIDGYNSTNLLFLSGKESTLIGKNLIPFSLKNIYFQFRKYYFSKGGLVCSKHKIYQIHSIPFIDVLCYFILLESSNH